MPTFVTTKGATAGHDCGTYTVCVASMVIVAENSVRIVNEAAGRIAMAERIISYKAENT